MNTAFKFSIISLSALYLLFLIPALEIISSAPEDFSNVWKIIGILFYIYIFSFAVLFFIFKKLSSKNKNKFSFFMMFVLLYFLANYYIFTGSYGLMDYFVFHNDDVFDTSLKAILIDVFIIIVLIITTFILMKFKKTKSILVFISLALLFSSFRFAYLISSKETKEIATTKHSIIKPTKSKLDKQITFSKNAPNVLIIFFDRFMGGYVPDILKDKPSLKKDLSGFVWYPNSLSFGTGTAVGLAPVYGGYEFANAKAMLATKYKWSFRIYNSKYMKDRYEKSTKFMLEKFYDKGYDATIFDPNFLSIGQLKNMSKKTFKFKHIKGNPVYLNTFYYPYELSNTANKSPFSMIKEYIIPFSIFKVSSQSIRKSIYNDGAWYAGLSSVSMNYIEVIREISYARSWSYISQVKDKANGSFNFITSNLTHHVPVNRNMNNTFQGVIPKYTKKDEQRFKSKQGASHYYLAKEALSQLAKWIKWLKKNKIYDNTKIIITSDHGAPSVFNPMFKHQNSADNIHYGSYHTNLMVKDFNKTNNLEINNTFMTHADVPYLALEAIDENAKKKYGYDKSKGFRLYTNYKDKGSLVVHDDIFKEKNWIYKIKDNE